MGFIGRYKHTLDPKGRVFVPKKFLAAFPDTEPRHLTITRGFEGCLSLYTASAWRNAVDAMQAKARGDREVRLFKRMIYSSATQQTIDGSGRILVPEDLRQDAGLDREVMFVGLEDEIELWDLQTWEKYQASASDQFEQAGREVF